MFEKGILMGLFAETSLHPGTGITTRSIDLPIQREKHTDFSIIHSSGLKGAIRETAEKALSPEEVNIIFGPKNTEHAGSIGITDARILAFPVRSLTDVYVWITCPRILNKLKRDFSILKNKSYDNLQDLDVTIETVLVSDNTNLKDKLILEEMSFSVNDSKRDEVKKWIDEIIKLLPDNPIYQPIKDKMQKHIVIINDEDFKYLISYGTQVSARIVLEDNKTSNNLWYEESLPIDTLFYSMIFVMKPRNGDETLDIVSKLDSILNDYIQIGGNETVGMGWCAVKCINILIGGE